jgi:hypothetical protein
MKSPTSRASGKLARGNTQRVQKKPVVAILFASGAQHARLQPASSTRRKAPKRCQQPRGNHHVRKRKFGHGSSCEDSTACLGEAQASRHSTYDDAERIRPASRQLVHAFTQSASVRVAYNKQARRGLLNPSYLVRAGWGPPADQGGHSIKLNPERRDRCSSGRVAARSR